MYNWIAGVLDLPLLYPFWLDWALTGIVIGGGTVVGLLLFVTLRSRRYEG